MYEIKVGEGKGREGKEVLNFLEYNIFLGKHWCSYVTVLSTTDTFLFLLSLGRLLIPPPSVHVHAHSSTNCENPHNEYMYEASPCHGTNKLIKSPRAKIKTLRHSVGAT